MGWGGRLIHGWICKMGRIVSLVLCLACYLVTQDGGGGKGGKRKKDIEGSRAISQIACPDHAKDPVRAAAERHLRFPRSGQTLGRLHRPTSSSSQPGFSLLQDSMPALSGQAIAKDQSTQTKKRRFGDRHREGGGERERMGVSSERKRRAGVI